MKIIENLFKEHKRALTVLLAAVIMLTSGACGAQQTQTTIAASEPAKSHSSGPQLSDEEPVQDASEIHNLIPEEDPRYAKVLPMESSICCVAEYLEILPEFDLNALTADDFWNLIAILIADSNSAPDQYGVYHVSPDLIWEYAETFCSGNISEDGLPSFEDTYSASQDSFTSKIDLLPLNISNYLRFVDHLEFVNDSDDFIAVVHLTKEDDKTQTNVMRLTLSEWEDAESRIFPYKVLNAEKGATIYAEPEEISGGTVGKN